MKIQPIYPITNNFRKTSAFKNSSASSDVQQQPTQNISQQRDEAIIEYIKEMKDINKKNQYISAGAILFSIAAIPLIFLTASKTGRARKKDIKQTVIREFVSLKDNKEIPTLDTCKSISKELKNFLQTQINYLKATDEEIKAAGMPKPATKLLLYGEPGTGKTFFGKIFAKTLGADYMEIKYTDMNSIWTGEHLDNMRKEFENIIMQAQSHPDKKYVVIFNEIDAIVQPAQALIGTSSGGHSAFKIEERSVFLTYLDAIAEKAPNVTIIGTTNIIPKKSSLDSAAMSRFKNIMCVDYPDDKCLKEAIKSGINNIGIEAEFMENNHERIERMASEMVKRRCSYRDLDYIIDQSKNYYLSDYMKDKTTKFKFEYIEKALKDHGITDGEIAGVA